MNVSTRFIVIDDDEFNNKICTVTLEKIDKEAKKYIKDDSKLEINKIKKVTK